MAIRDRAIGYGRLSNCSLLRMERVDEFGGFPRSTHDVIRRENNRLFDDELQADSRRNFETK
jgi:hypothetical protein